MTPPRHRIIETLTRVAPLGVRFLDSVTRQPVTELQVTATAGVHASRPLTLRSNSAGVYGLHYAPGLRDFMNGVGDQAFWADMPEAKSYIIAVRDPLGRFLPFTFTAAVPAQRVLAWSCAAPATGLELSEGALPLFSTVQRAIPAGFCAVRADLYNPIADGPAAWAVVEISYEGRLLGRGVADQAGRLCIPIAYPQPIDFEPLSPAISGAPATEQVWQLGVQVWYRQEEPQAQPDLCRVLNQIQGTPARVWSSWESPVGSDWLHEATLIYGRDLVLRTQAGGRSLAWLYVAPA